MVKEKDGMAKVVMYLSCELPSPYGSTEKAAYNDRLAQTSTILRDTAREEGRLSTDCVLLFRVKMCIQRPKLQTKHPSKFIKNKGNN